MQVQNEKLELMKANELLSMQQQVDLQTVSPLSARKVAEWDPDYLSTTRIDPGVRVIFMPDQPGVYVALQLGDLSNMIDDAQSMGSIMSNASKTSL